MDIFDEWKQLTRSFFSMKIALDREAALWSSIEIKSPAQTELEVTRGPRTYRVKLAEHTATVLDEHPLCAMALNLSYSLAEAFARSRLHVERLDGGIEGWGTLLLAAVHRDWTDVLDGKQGLIEVAVARSAVAHGATVAQSTIDRFSGVGICPWQVGNAIRLTFETTQVYRDRLKSLLRACSGRVKTPKPARSKKKKEKKPKTRPKDVAREARRALRIAYRTKVRESKA